MSKVWARLGAAVGSVALLAGGLVGVAAPAQAEDWTKCDESMFLHDSEDAAKANYEGTFPTWNSSCDSYDYTRVIYKEITDNTWGNAGKWDWFVEGTNGGGPTPAECEANGQVLNDEGTECRDKTAEETCEESGKYWYDNSCNEKSPSENQCLESGDVWEDGECREWEEIVDIETPTPPGAGAIEGAEGKLYTDVYSLNDSPGPPTSEHVLFILSDGVTQAWGIPVPADVADGEAVQKNPPPPPCWSAEALNNCPVGGALRFAAPEYAMVGVPVTMYAYASWRPDANSPAQPTNGTAVIRVDGEDYSGVEFKDGVAEWRFIPEEEGMKEFTASGVVFSGLSGASAYIDTVPARTYVLEYDPAAYEDALKKKVVEVGEKFTITDRDQAKSYLNDRYEWRVADKSKDVCAVYETKKGAIKAKFNEAGKCKVIWMDTESAEKGKFSFVAKK